MMNPKGVDAVSNNPSDSELKSLVHHTKIKIVGVGGAGNNTLDTLNSLGIAGVEIVAVNTDAQDLLNTAADHKVLIGKESTRGLGAGNDPSEGEKAAIENIDDVKKKIQGSDAVFLTCGLGGGTGTGAIPVIAEACRKLGILTIAVVSLPFTVEGKRRQDNANTGLLKLEKYTDSLIVVPNDRLLSTVPDMPLIQAFRLVDNVLANAIKGIVDLVTKPGLVNLDFADLKAVMKGSGVGLIAIGEADSVNRASEAVENAFGNPLLDVDLSKAEGALVNVLGGKDFTLDEANLIVNKVGERLDPDAKIIWGSQLDDAMGKKIRVFVVVTGLRSRSFVDAHADKAGFVWIDEFIR
jgi:cell division protein FtsZ